MMDVYGCFKEIIYKMDDLHLATWNVPNKRTEWFTKYESERYGQEGYSKKKGPLSQNKLNFSEWGILME
jgi:hypothetical protein